MECCAYTPLDTDSRVCQYTNILIFTLLLKSVDLDEI